MKKIIALLVVVVMALALSVTTYGATAENPLQIKKVTTAPVIDGVIDPAEWGDPVVKNTGKESIANFLATQGVATLAEFFVNADGTINAAPGGAVLGFGDVGSAEDLAAREAFLNGITTTTYIRWDDANLYIATDIQGMGTSHHNEITDPVSIWGQDNVQYMFSDITFPYANGNTEIGFAMNSLDSSLMQYKWTDNLAVGFEKTTFKVTKSAEHFIYESQIPWVEVGLEAAIAEGTDFAFNECFNFSVPASATLTANPESVTATRAAIESYKEGGILNGKNALASFPAKLVAAPAVVVEETPAEETTDANPETADTMMAGWLVLAVLSAFVAFNTVRKFCK